MSIPAGELKEIEVIEEHSSLSRSLFSLIPAMASIMARSDTTTIFFGYGLCLEELRWIRAEICRTLLR